MALLRLLTLPSTSHFSTQQRFFSPTPFFSSLTSLPQPNPSFAPPISSLSLSTSSLPVIKPQRPNLFLLRTQSAIGSPQLETPPSEVEQQEEEEYEDEGSRTRLVAQNLPWTCTADDIRPLFQQHGTVVDVELVMYDKKKTRNIGMAFITMSSNEEASAALANLDSYEFMGRTLRLNWAKPKKKKPSPPVRSRPVPVHNLFVANLPFQARSKDLMEFFNAENANAVSAEVIFHDNPRASAGYGFVAFNTKEEADAALSNLQGKMLMGRPIRVAYSKRFLRQSTKKALESKDELGESETEAVQEQAVEEVEA